MFKNDGYNTRGYLKISHKKVFSQLIFKSLRLIKIIHTEQFKKNIFSIFVM